jgi:hypothetical protein
MAGSEGCFSRMGRPYFLPASSSPKIIVWNPGVANLRSKYYFVGTGLITDRQLEFAGGSYETGSDRITNYHASVWEYDYGSD